MVRNRSGYGPFKNFWFSDYVNQFEKSTSMGLVGSTINFSGFSDIKIKGTLTHIQTYVYLSKWKHFKKIKDQYPGNKCSKYKEAVINGEIGLSQYMLSQGLQLSCLNWPKHIFDLDFLTDPNLSQVDVKKAVKDLPIIFRHASYFRKLENLPIRFSWFIKRTFSMETTEKTKIEYLESP